MSRLLAAAMRRLPDEMLDLVDLTEPIQVTLHTSPASVPPLYEDSHVCPELDRLADYLARRYPIETGQARASGTPLVDAAIRLLDR